MRRGCLAIALLFTCATHVCAGENDVVLDPETAIADLARYCVDTGASSEKLLATIRQRNLPAHDVAITQDDQGGTAKVQLSPDHKLDATIAKGGIVTHCFMHFFLRDAPATAAVVGKRFGISGRIEDYPDIDSERMTKLAPRVIGGFRFFKMEEPDDFSGTLTAVIIPEVGSN
jgi:hypothetical protein